MAVKLLIYEKKESGGNPNQVIIRNNTFESGTDNWGQTGGGDWTPDGAGGIQCIGTGPSLFFTFFASDMIAGLYYDVEFDISGWNGQGLDIFLGLTQIGSVTANGHYVLTYHAPDQQVNVPITIGFRTSSSSLQVVLDNVYIKQNILLSPSVDGFVYFEESGYVDMYPDVNIGLNFQVSDVTKVSGKLGSFSKRFEVCGSQNNREVFSHLYSNNIVPSIFDPRNKTRAKLIDDAEGSVIIDGWLTLSHISFVREEVRFEVELYDNSFGLLDGIKGRKMKELNLSNFNHILSRDNVVNTWDTGWTYNNCFVYPILYKDISEYNIGDDFYPFFYDRKLLEQVIQEEAGFGFTLSPLAENVITNKITSPNGVKPKINKNDAEQQRVDVTGSGLTWNAQTVTEYFAPSTGPIAVPDIELSTEISDNESLWNLESGIYIFTAPIAGEYDVSFSIPVSVALETLSITAPNSFSTSIDSYVSPQPIKVKAQLVSQTYSTVIADTNEYVRTTPNGTSATTMTFSTENITLQFSGVKTLTFGEKVFLRIYIDNQLSFNYYAPFPIIRVARPKDTVTLQSGSFLRISYSLTNEIDEGSYIAMNDFLPNSSMEDFLIDQATQMNLFILPNGPRRIDLITRTEFYDPTKPYVDWTGLLDKDSEVKIQYLTEVSSSEVEFGYKESDDFYNEEYKSITKGPQYGDKTFLYGTDLYSTKETIRLKNYEPTPIISNIAGDLLPAILSTELPSSARNLLWGPKYNNVQDIKLFSSGGTVNEAFTDRRTALHINSIDESSLDINFGQVEFALTNSNINLTQNNLYNLFYADQTQLFKKTRMYTAWFKLNNQKVEEIVKDMGKRIWIGELNNYFLLDSIVDFDPINNGITKVQLLQWIPTAGVYDAPAIAQATQVRSVVGYSNLTQGVNFNSLNMGENNFVEYAVGYTRGGSVFGNNNRLFSQGYYVNGTGNTIDAGSNDVFLFGTNNLHVSGGTYANFFNGALTINQYNSSFYSAVTISNTGVTVGMTDVGLSGITVGGSGGTIISYSSITIGGVVITSGFTEGIARGNFLPISGGTMTGDTIFSSGKTVKFVNGPSTGSFTISGGTDLFGDQILNSPNDSGTIALKPKCREVSSNFSVSTDFQYHMCDTSIEGFRMDLPADPAVGEQYHFFDLRGTFSTGNVTISGGTYNVGASTALVLNVDHQNCFVTWNGQLWSPFLSA